MAGPLSGLRVIEGAAFVAAPLCGLHLAQLGAEVIRFDQIGGGPDFRRWPQASNGASLYWEGLNKGKRSVALDLSRPEGRALAVRLATAPGPASGLFVTNYPADGFLSHARLATLRADLITVRVMGWADCTPALDYTVNAALGVPLMTGPASLGAEPVNHVLPAWDLITGTYAAFALLAAERHRRETGAGQEVRVPLGDIAMASLAALGQVAEAKVTGDRARHGNDLYGAFGRDFLTGCGQRIMLTAITPRQWSGLVDALGISAAVGAIETEVGVSFDRDEGLRFRHRDRLFPVVAAALAERHLADLRPVFDRLGVCWSAYRSVGEAVDAVMADNPSFAFLKHPSGERYPTPGAPGSFGAFGRADPVPAQALGADTTPVLREVLALSDGEIASLREAGIIGGTP